MEVAFESGNDRFELAQAEDGNVAIEIRSIRSTTEGFSFCSLIVVEPNKLYAALKPFLSKKKKEQ